MLVTDWMLHTKHAAQVLEAIARALGIIR